MEKSPIKVPFIIYADVESLLEKMSTYHNNTEKSSTIKINEHTPSGYSLFTHCSFDLTKNKLDCYKGKDGIEKFCKRKCNKNNQLWKKKKEMIPLTDEENKSSKKKKVCHVSKKGFSTDDDNKKRP